jgi:hypothetical protein
MIKFLIGLFRLALLVLILLLVLQPDLLPAPLNGVGTKIHTTVCGPIPGYQVCITKAQVGWQWLTQMLPYFASVKGPFATAPTTLTLDALTIWAKNEFVHQPLTRFEFLHQNLRQTSIATSSPSPAR